MMQSNNWIIRWCYWSWINREYGRAKETGNCRHINPVDLLGNHLEHARSFSVKSEFTQARNVNRYGQSTSRVCYQKRGNYKSMYVYHKYNVISIIHVLLHANVMCDTKTHESGKLFNATRRHLQTLRTRTTFLMTYLAINIHMHIHIQTRSTGAE